MKTSEEIVNILFNNIDELKRTYDLSSMGIFGSYITGNQNKNSDLDILVEFDNPVSLIKFIKLENDLTDILGIKVDLVLKKALKPNIGKRVLKEIQYVS